MIIGPLLMATALVVTAVVCSLAAGTWLPHRLAGAAGIGLVLLTLSVPRWLAAATDLPVAVTSGCVVGLLLATAILTLAMRRRHFRPSSVATLTWIGSTIGAVVWVTSVVAAQVVPGGARIAWVLNGDGLNYLTVASESLAQPSGGLARIPYAVLTVIASPMGALELAGDTIASDAVSLVIAWTLMLALWCIVSGAVTSSLLSPDTRTGIVVAATGGSLLPLTAYFGGIPMEWGYVNANVAIPAALLTWLALTEHRRHPFASLSVLAVIVSVLWMSWEPLAVIPGVAVLVLLWRLRRHFRELRGVRLVIVGLAAGQFVFVFANGYLSRVTNAPRWLTIEGHGLPSSAIGLAVVVLISLVLSIGWRQALPRWALTATLTLIIGGALALAVVLRFSLGPNVWTGYYPTKLTYFLTVLLMTIGAALAVGVVTRVVKLRVLGVGLAAVVMMLTVLIAALVAPTAPGLEQAVWRRQPVIAVLQGTQWSGGDALSRTVLRFADPARPGFLWRSGNPDEGVIDFQILVTNGAGLRGDVDLRKVAFRGYQGRRASADFLGVPASMVCTVIERVPHITIITTDVSAARSDLAAECELDPEDVPIARYG